MQPTEWPEHLIYALEMMAYPRPYSDDIVADILSRWGSVEVEVFERMLAQEHADYIVFALFALGYAPTPQMREVFVPFLSSEKPKERWASAFALGKLKDERALPVLTQMLEEFLSGNERDALEKKDEWQYEDWRCSIPALLADFNRPTLSAVLRYALQETVRLEETGQAHTAQKHMWLVFKQELVHALGRLSAFGSLIGIQVEERVLGVWIVHLAVGSLYESYPKITIIKWQQNPRLHQDVQERLEHFFGLEQETREQYLTWYQKDMFRKNYSMYYEEQVRLKKGESL